MNPSGGVWQIPPPPGTEVSQGDEDEVRKGEESDIKAQELPHKVDCENESNVIKNDAFDIKAKIVDPFLKSPEYLEYEKKRRSRSRDRSRHRRRSTSRSRYSERHKKRYRSKSRRYRRSRSRGRRHRRRRSCSSTRSRHSKSKRERRHRRSRSRNRRYSRSRSRSRRHYSRAQHEEHRSDSDKDDPMNTSGEVDDDDEPAAKENAFKNDGSFLEMFKKMQEEQQKAAEAAKEQAGCSEDKLIIPPIPKRRGGRILKTGMVEKAKVIDEFMQGDGLDAWSVYMKEVELDLKSLLEAKSKILSLVHPFISMVKYIFISGTMPTAVDANDVVLQTAPFDPRFPNTNQTRYCYTSFLDYHRCQKAKGTDYAPCDYFKKVYTSMCPNEWVDKWNNQLEEGTFNGKI
ncbi:hypothetical protein FQA39_LY11391 [Lamprigera yunnana]|nr:hypothetical protein FQA39_LY11391 [Lamprigera yunnana]